MKALIQKLRKKAPRVWSVPDGMRLYAIGDVHGRDDCLGELLAMIDADDALRAPAETTLIFLGDLCDRGYDSCAVVQRLMRLQRARRCVFLMGNHEEILIRAWDGERAAAALLNRVGGRETLLSYGIDPEDYEGATIDELTVMIHEAIPAGHIAFLRRFCDQYVVGDYAFVHAGIRPGVALADQAATDLRWIRRDFIDSRVDHGVMVIHGHTVTPEVDIRPNRIGIDTGAFATGRLTAIMLEGDTRAFLNTGDPPPAI